MMTAEEIQERPRSDKLRLMQALWEDLSGRTAREDVASPKWHGVELAEIAHRTAAGMKAPIDWAIAKKQPVGERSCG